ncbi:riboflavin synthase [Marinicella sp. S1101]|uniref:riboflavin synthase n=1 Tax=Marinicella marina TaxID=2996016 RepID=UPI002260D808|nr:riboflavin synthase [Marinicella marina]MCX7554898.1 riboflavin synthase [Marinicella marina]MDJ1141278.1 riboflavin synthase [Marinicella marina]
MFTGIIQTIGQVTDKKEKSGDLSFKIKTNFSQPEQIKLGDSIAMDGVCLTVTAKADDEVNVDVSVETVNKTTVNQWQTGTALNLEPAMTLQDQLGGHIVSGHVDAVGQCISREPSARSEIFEFEIPHDLMKFVVVKGSITINGVSLTVNTVEDNRLSVNLVPHTMQHTNLGGLTAGDAVNIEIDTIARYVEKMLQPHLLNKTA